MTAAGITVSGSRPRFRRLAARRARRGVSSDVPHAPEPRARRRRDDVAAPGDWVATAVFLGASQSGAAPLLLVLGDLGSRGRGER